MIFLLLSYFDHDTLPCRNAFVGVVVKGGLRGLYTGWGAVLCRNVPHSIIKVRIFHASALKQKNNVGEGGKLKSDNGPSVPALHTSLDAVVLSI